MGWADPVLFSRSLRSRDTPRRPLMDIDWDMGQRASSSPTVLRRSCELGENGSVIPGAKARYWGKADMAWT